jgi:LssY C-terminus
MAAIIVIIAGKIATLMMDYNLSSLQTIDYYVALDRFDFISGHIAVTAITFGILAVLVSHSMGRWSRAVVVAMCSLLVIAIAYSRVYLGVQWFSGALAGLLFGAVMVAAFGVAIEAIPPRRIRPLGLMTAAIAAFIVAGIVNIDRNFGRAEAFYAPPQRLFSLSRSTWLDTGWKHVPNRRIDLAGRQEEAFHFQYAGSLDALRNLLAASGWRDSPKWTWKNGIQYLDLKATLETMAPRPALHQGLFARVTMTRQVDNDKAARLVLRAFKTEAVITDNRKTSPVYLISLTEERVLRRFHTYAVPVLASPSEPEINELSAVFSTAVGLRVETRAEGSMLLVAPL